MIVVNPIMGGGILRAEYGSFRTSGNTEGSVTVNIGFKPIFLMFRYSSSNVIDFGYYEESLGYITGVSGTWSNIKPFNDALGSSFTITENGFIAANHGGHGLYFSSHYSYYAVGQ